VTTKAIRVPPSIIQYKKTLNFCGFFADSKTHKREKEQKKKKKKKSSSAEKKKKKKKK
jgi:hypothetical protein